MYLSCLLLLVRCGPEEGRLAEVAGAAGKADALDLNSGAWLAERAWSEIDEDVFSLWIAQLGRARSEGLCSTLANCLASPQANMLWAPEDQGRQIYADCADLPYVVRAYFAYKNKLPFAFASAIQGGRYTTGNTVLAHRSYLSYRSLNQLLVGISNLVHSGFFRLAAEVEQSDHYPVAINRQAVRPGTIYYDPNGHVLLVYAVEDDGTVRMIDGHPDNSLTVKRFGQAFARGAASQGGGFRNWREIWHEGGGRIVRAANRFARHFDPQEQYAASFLVEGHQVGYHEWVRARLSLSGGRRKPVAVFREMLVDLCVDVQSRVDAVDKAMEVGLHQALHPGALPDNIYGTDGDWESYSSPARDARLKATFRELHQLVSETVRAITAGDTSLFDFSGSPRELLRQYQLIWDGQAASCTLVYTNSKGHPVALSLGDVMDRLFALSFDPYHCPELRWGASPDAPELLGEYQGCPDSPDKLWWYRAEQRLRNRIDRVYDSGTPLDLGPEVSPEVHLPRLLASLYAAAPEDLFLREAFVGTPCRSHEDCGGLQQGLCVTYAGASHGFCSLPCQTYCPDRQGSAMTFCVASTELSGVALPPGDSGQLPEGLCVSRADDENGYCADLPAMAVGSLPRLNQPQKVVDVCVPASLADTK